MRHGRPDYVTVQDEAPFNLLAYMRAAFVVGVMVGVVLGYGLSVWGLR